MGELDPRGVNERLVQKVRDALDAEGFGDVRIVVSGGFTVEKIARFEERGVPVDAYGVGSSLLRGCERLHGGRRAHRRRTVGQGRPLVPAEPAARAGYVASAAASGPGQRASGSVERTTCTPASAKRAKAASASSV